MPGFGKDDVGIDARLVDRPDVSTRAIHTGLDAGRYHGHGGTWKKTTRRESAVFRFVEGTVVRKRDPGR